MFDTYNAFDVGRNRLSNRELRAICELVGKDQAFADNLRSAIAPVLSEFDEQDARNEEFRQRRIREAVVYCAAIELRAKETGRTYGSDKELEAYKARVR